MRFANKKLGMGRDGFCQGIASISNMLILALICSYLPALPLTVLFLEVFFYLRDFNFFVLCDRSTIMFKFCRYE